MAFLGVIAACATSALAGCETTGAEATKEAEETQRRANEQIATAQREADEKARAAQASADQKVQELTRNFAKTRDDYVAAARRDMDRLEKRIADLQIEAVKKTGETKVDLDRTLKEIAEQRAAVEKELAEVEATAADQFDAARAKLDKHIDELEHALDHASRE